MLFEILDQQLSDLRKFALALRDGVELDALNEHFDQSGGLWQVAPLRRNIIYVDVVLEAVEATDHHLQDAHTNSVDVFEHEHLHFFFVR